MEPKSGIFDIELDPMMLAPAATSSLQTQGVEPGASLMLGHALARSMQPVSRSNVPGKEPVFRPDPQNKKSQHAKTRIDYTGESVPASRAIDVVPYPIPTQPAFIGGDYNPLVGPGFQAWGEAAKGYIKSGTKKSPWGGDWTDPHDEPHAEVRSGSSIKLPETKNPRFEKNRQLVQRMIYEAQNKNRPNDSIKSSVEQSMKNYNLNVSGLRSAAKMAIQALEGVTDGLVLGTVATLPPPARRAQ